MQVATGKQVVTGVRKVKVGIERATLDGVTEYSDKESMTIQRATTELRGAEIGQADGLKVKGYVARTKETPSIPVTKQEQIPELFPTQARQAPAVISAGILKETAKIARNNKKEQVKYEEK